MSSSDAIVIGEEWISEHYFTTDAKKQSFLAQVIQRRKQWDEHKELGSVRTRFAAARRDVLSTLVTIEPDDDRLPELYQQIERVLGYDRPGITRTTDGPLVRVSAAGMDGPAPLVIIHAQPVASVEDLLAKDANTLLTPYEVDDTTTLTSAARTASTLFTDADHPEFILILAGRFALVAERARWAEGRFLAVDLQLVCERNDDKRAGEVDRALTCLSAESLAPDADGDIWWNQPLEESVKHTVGVSQDLRDGVRLSIEIIANDVVSRREEQGLPPLPAEQGNELAKQSLRFLYRILFLLYAEASPELGVLPVGAPEYERGYSLDRLRDLTLVELTNPAARTGTHLYDSLSVLFNLVDQGHDPGHDGEEHQGLAFRSLRADLFSPKATAHIDEVGLGNAAVQEVLQHLLLSKEKRGSDRGFISYAELGINQLGAVYEGLMSYTGFFADTDLYEVAKDGDASKGSWVVPVERAEGLDAKDFVKAEDPVTGEMRPVLHRRGSFVYRLAGRERQQSASYYTPEVLTRFVVSQALAELLDQDDSTTPAREILDLTICEPALGSGAFAIEAVRQLAEEYLKRRQGELGDRIDPDDYPRELAKVKAYLALHQTYGVDLNATAVELAEISLWLDTMVEGLQAPWFGLHLRRGNSLVGARRVGYTTRQLTKKAWLKAIPEAVPLSDEAEGDGTWPTNRIHSFLLPAEGWGSAIGAKEGKALAPDRVTALRDWRKTVLRQPNKAQAKALAGLAERVESLWQIAIRRLSIAETEIRRTVDVWGADGLPTGGAVSREQIEASLADPDSAYRRLRRVMDAWCALWFWPLTDTIATDSDGNKVSVSPPNLESWLEVCQQLLGTTGKTGKEKYGPQVGFDEAASWDDLNDAEVLDLDFAGAEPTNEVLLEHPWLQVCERVAREQGFFHWELDFAPVFARGGFDLQVGNPPWVRPRADVDALLAESDPWWQLAIKPKQEVVKARRLRTLELPGARDLVLVGTGETASLAAFLGAPQEYPGLAGLQPDLYRCFVLQTWNHRSKRGVSALIHPETHFTDEKAQRLREACYARLRRHWQFVNSLLLFEIKDNKRYGVHVYSSERAAPSFLNAACLYHPDTVTRSLRHDGSGMEPGLRTAEGEWDLSPHSGRIVTVNPDVLSSWRDVLEDPSKPRGSTRMLFLPNSSSLEVLKKLRAGATLGEGDYSYCAGWVEGSTQAADVIDVEYGVPESWESVVLQGVHLYVANPRYKFPNASMSSNQDWSLQDLESLEPDSLPTTTFKPIVDMSTYRQKFPVWDEGRQSSLDFYRIAWRAMADNVGKRTMLPVLIPKGAAHVDSVFTMGNVEATGEELALLAAGLSSFLVDFLVRAAPKSTIRANVFERLPKIDYGTLSTPALLRVLRLNCLTSAYSELWQDCYRHSFGNERWTAPEAVARCELGNVESEWSPSVPLRRAVERRRAELELDALTALALDVSADQLCTVYRDQFPVLVKAEKASRYDAKGRLVPGSVVREWRKQGHSISEADRTATNAAGNTYTYELPFVTLDREADMRHAYAHFERILQERS